MGPEAKLQARVVKWARDTYAGRVLVRKFQGGMYGSGGYPDYDFIVKGKPARIFMIEFKAPGAHPSPLQLQRHAELRAMGVDVYVCDNEPAAKGIIKVQIERNGKHDAFNPRREVPL